ncbi:TPA: hypothetical protein LUJ70_001411 [Acinetobacter baumannii]|uniref:hypothetical protein n=1 Tax=Acinetobacter baumannii TaxID=470 RepID=UPI0002974AE5|nr:hypothetical protein [Acinetobacter baumannii]EHU1925205.1 hypothetical protein [Acinetobacter baumannii]EHU1989906.1 hypothetical protein [Acinetobacter baumannii]EHU2640177.1 hypothetical protein [Acinetobacter baumannii]EHU3111297.1 hypothetical protein [Acinetobacter baumannii]EKP37876.1 hypothetical protein ACIN5065_0550 [Acinetobacter baumannii OIFC065]
MNKSVEQTKQLHTQTTMVRWTEPQFETLRKLAFEQKKQPAVFIREFILKHCPELASSADERL